MTDREKMLDKIIEIVKSNAIYKSDKYNAIENLVYYNNVKGDVCQVCESELDISEYKQCKKCTEFLKIEL
jgi:hypothetical protein